MRLRDRRSPLTALELLIAYLLLFLVSAGWIAQLAGFAPEADLSPALLVLLAINLASFVWRAAWRFAFTAREYGAAEGLRAILRIPVTNVISIMAGRRAFVAYVASLGGRNPRWDKTEHIVHPALAAPHREAA